MTLSGPMPPLGLLKYLYVGSSDFAKDFPYYRDVLGGEVVWNFHAFDANVAAFRLADGPLVLLADHRKPPSCMPIFCVEDLDATVKALKKRGWTATAGPFGIPDGPCYTFRDPSGNEYGVFGNERPDALVASYEEEHSHGAGGKPRPRKPGKKKEK